MDEILNSLKKAGRAAFRTREYAALLSKGAYARLVLSRLRKKGELARVRNGWWAFPDAMAQAVACEVSKPAYLSFHSALSLRGLTTQIPRSMQLAVARSPKKYEVFGTPVMEYRVKSFSGFSNEGGLLLVLPEKALADCLSVPRACPEIVLLEAAGNMDARKAEPFLSGKPAKARLKKVIAHAGQKRA